MKKGKLTAIESSCVKGMVADNVSTADIATQLNRGLATIEKEVERIKANAVREQLFLNTTAAGTKGVSIMTERASVAGDNPKEASSETPPKKTHSSSIHKIRADG